MATAAIELAARRSNYGTLVTSLQVGDEAEIDEALGFLVNRGVDGLIAVAPSTGIARAAVRAARGVPMVVVADGFAPSEHIHVVSVDQGLGAGMAVRHLAGRGRSRIAHIAGPGETGSTPGRGPASGRAARPGAGRPGGGMAHSGFCRPAFTGSSSALHDLAQVPDRFGLVGRHPLADIIDLVVLGRDEALDNSGQCRVRVADRLGDAGLVVRRGRR